MTSQAPLFDVARAKINLTLRVLGRRADGYHELDSLVAFATIGDLVTLTPGAPPTVAVTGPFSQAITGENLVDRALRMVADRLREAQLGAIAINKQLPVAAGIGGGSADAAAALRLLRQANRNLAERDEWSLIAAALGSDVPVCLAGERCRMSGLGEVLEPRPSCPKLSAVLINPQIPVPDDKTQQVFARLNAPPVPSTPLKRVLEPQSDDAWIEHIRDGHNDLEPAAQAIMPAVAEVLAAARVDPRVLCARLSGAGPTCFALTATPQDAAAVAADVAERHPAWWVRAVGLA